MAPGEEEQRPARGPHAEGQPGDDVRGRAGLGRLGDSLRRPLRLGGVVLGDEPDGDAQGQPDDHRAVEAHPGLRAEPADQRQGHDQHHDGGAEGPEVQGGLGVAALLRPHDEGAGDGAEDPEGRDHQRQDHVVQGVRHLAEAGGEGQAQDHAPDDGAHVGLEEVGAHPADVAHVVAHEVGDDRGVAGVVLGDARLDLAHQVGSHVGGLRVDAAAHAGEQRDRRGAEAEPGEHLEHLVLHDVEARCRTCWSRRRTGSRARGRPGRRPTCP